MRGGGLHASSCEDVDAGLGLTGIGRMPSSEPEGPSNSGPACAPLRPRLIRCSASSVALPLLHSLCAQHTSRPHASSWNKNPYRSILTAQVIFETGIQLDVQVKKICEIFQPRRVDFEAWKLGASFSFLIYLLSIDPSLYRWFSTQVSFLEKISVNINFVLNIHYFERRKKFVLKNCV